MRIKTAARRQAMINVAGELFLDEGYAAVSMAAISTKLGGSRVTLYNYFSTKEELFEAFVVEAGRERVAVLLATSPPEESKTLNGRLLALGKNYLRLALDPRVLAIERLIVGEARRFPELTRIFYEHGPKDTLLRMMRILESEMTSGCLRRAALRATTLHFIALCEAGLHQRRLWGLDGEISEEEIEQAAASAVDAFLQGYASSADAND